MVGRWFFALCAWIGIAACGGRGGTDGDAPEPVPAAPSSSAGPYDGLSVALRSWPLMNVNGTGAQVGTGVAWVDLDRDGDLDAVVSNGNDIAPQMLRVHDHERKWSRGSRFPLYPSQWGARPGYYGAVCVGDVDGDGWQDVAAVRPWDLDLELGGGGVDVYLNRRGRLVYDAAWSVTGVAVFECDLGDVDGDGRPDLAIAPLFEGALRATNPGTALLKVWLSRKKAPARVLRNTGAGFGAALWKSPTSDGYFAVRLSDVDEDGRLDLVTAGQHLYVFYGKPGGLEASPGFVGEESLRFPYGLAVGPLGGEGQSVIVNGRGLLSNGPAPYLRYDPVAGSKRVQRGRAWRTDGVVNPGPPALVDLDEDGDLDLLGGSWGGRLQGGPLLAFPLDGGRLSRVPCARSEERLVHQHIAVGGLTGPAKTATSTVTARGDVHVVTLPHRPLSVLSVTVEGRAVAGPGSGGRPPRFSWSPGHREVVVRGVKAGAVIAVEHSFRPDHDVLVANWEPDEGDWVYPSRKGFLGLQKNWDLSCGPSPAPVAMEAERVGVTRSSFEIEGGDSMGKFNALVADIQTAGAVPEQLLLDPESFLRDEYDLDAAEIEAFKNGDLSQLVDELDKDEMEVFIRAISNADMVGILSPYPWPWPWPYPGDGSDRTE